MTSLFDSLYDYKIPEELFCDIPLDRIMYQYSKGREEALNKIKEYYASNHIDKNILQLKSGRYVYLNPENEMDKQLPIDVLERIKINIDFDKLSSMGFFTDDEIYDKYHRKPIDDNEKLNLRYCIFLDVIYNIIFKKQDKFLLGKAKLSDIIKANKCMLNFGLFSTRKEELKAIFDKDKFWGEELVLEVFGDKVRYDKLEKDITRNKDKKIDKIFNYFYQFLTELFEVNEETDKAHKKEKKYYIKSKRRKNDIYINKEYLMLYSKLHYNYFANWLVKYYKADKNKISYPYSCYNQGDLICNNTRIAKIRGCNVKGNLDSIINIKEVYPEINESHGNCFSKREIYTALDFFYIYETFQCFTERFKYCISASNLYDQEIKLMFFYIYGTGYLLNNMKFFSIQYLNFLKDILRDEDINEIDDEIPITSLYISSLIILLRETGSSDIALNVVLKEVDKYNKFLEKIVEETNVSKYEDLKDLFLKFKEDSRFDVFAREPIMNILEIKSLHTSYDFVVEYLLQSRWIDIEEFKGRKFKYPKKQWDEMLIFYNKMKKQNRA